MPTSVIRSQICITAWVGTQQDSLDRCNLTSQSENVWEWINFTSSKNVSTKQFILSIAPLSPISINTDVQENLLWYLIHNTNKTVTKHTKNMKNRCKMWFSLRIFLFLKFKNFCVLITQKWNSKRVQIRKVCWITKQAKLIKFLYNYRIMFLIVTYLSEQEKMGNQSWWCITALKTEN